MWAIYALLAAVTAALMTIVGKVGLKQVDPTLATTIRSVFMFGIMLVISLSMQKYKLLGQIHGNALWAIIISALFGSLSWLFYFLALRDGTASKVASLDRLSIVFIIIMSVLFLSEKFSWQAGFGAGLIAIGAILIAIA